MAQISALCRGEKEGSHNQPEPSRKKSVWSAVYKHLSQTLCFESRLKPPSRGRAGGTHGTSAAAPGIGTGRAGYGLGSGSGGQGRLGTVLGELYCNVLY